MQRGRTSVFGLVLLLAASCGGSESAAPSSPSATTAAPATGGTAPARTVVPDVALRDVGTGADVKIRAAVARPDRPTLYWFWAPH